MRRLSERPAHNEPLRAQSVRTKAKHLGSSGSSARAQLWAFMCWCPCWCFFAPCASVLGPAATQPQTDKASEGGLDLESLPSIFKWPSECDTDVVCAESHDCIICLNALQPGEPCRRLPCSHAFHQPCIDRWLQQKQRCPLCNNDPLQTRELASMKSETMVRESARSDTPQQ